MPNGEAPSFAERSPPPHGFLKVAGSTRDALWFSTDAAPKNPPRLRFSRVTFPPAGSPVPWFSPKMWLISAPLLSLRNPEIIPPRREVLTRAPKSPQELGNRRPEG